MKTNTNSCLKYHHFFYGNTNAMYWFESKESYNIIIDPFSEARSQEILSSVNGSQTNPMLYHLTDDNPTRRLEDIKVNTLFVDFNGAQITTQDILDLPVRPHIITETTPGNYHVYWRMEICEQKEITFIQYKLAVKLGSEMNIPLQGNTMQLSGRKYPKTRNPWLGKIVYFNKDTTPIILQGFKESMQLETEPDAYFLDANTGS